VMTSAPPTISHNREEKARFRSIRPNPFGESSSHTSPVLGATEERRKPPMVRVLSPPPWLKNPTSKQPGSIQSMLNSVNTKNTANLSRLDGQDQNRPVHSPQVTLHDYRARLKHQEHPGKPDRNPQGLDFRGMSKRHKTESRQQNAEDAATCGSCELLDPEKTDENGALRRSRVSLLAAEALSVVAYHKEALRNRGIESPRGQALEEVESGQPRQSVQDMHGSPQDLTPTTPGPA
jgi:hypothetical protein